MKIINYALILLLSLALTTACNYGGDVIIPLSAHTWKVVSAPNNSMGIQTGDEFKFHDNRLVFFKSTLYKTTIESRWQYSPNYPSDLSVENTNTWSNDLYFQIKTLNNEKLELTISASSTPFVFDPI